MANTFTIFDFVRTCPYNSDEHLTINGYKFIWVKEFGWMPEDEKIFIDLC